VLELDFRTNTLCSPKLHYQSLSDMTSCIYQSSTSAI